MATSLILLSGGIDSTVCLAIAQHEQEQPLPVFIDFGQPRQRLESAQKITEHYNAELQIIKLDSRAWENQAQNLVFLSVATALAQAQKADSVIIGINNLDWSNNSQGRPEFITSFQELARPIEIKTPLINLGEAEIIRIGTELEAPLELTWSCQENGSHPCGICDGCNLRAHSFGAAQITDPAVAARLASPVSAQ